MRCVPVAPADAIAPKILRRIGEAYRVATLAVEAPPGSTDLPFQILARVVWDCIAKELCERPSPKDIGSVLAQRAATKIGA